MSAALAQCAQCGALVNAHARALLCGSPKMSAELPLTLFLAGQRPLNALHYRVPLLHTTRLGMVHRTMDKSDAAFL